MTRRCDIDGSTIGADQAITLDEALRAITIDAARQIGMGDRIGSLEKGKEADLVILEADPYETSPEKLGDIQSQRDLGRGREEIQRLTPAQTRAAPPPPARSAQFSAFCVSA